ncbi:zf-HC2 domain-containing protein [Streptomyces sp. NPDC057430]|uniref:zf-HC2 domain-containing protein n=1 Tax=Streptomyces sp. NPDC057430 TaxID=3346131 RepID=UPI003685C436
MTPSHQAPRTEVGAYVLGALEPEENTELEDHMRTCALCAEERRSLTKVADLLAEFAATGPDADELLAEETAPTDDRSVPAPVPFTDTKFQSLRRRHRQFLMLAASVAMFASGLAVGNMLGYVEDPNDPQQNPRWAAQLLLVGEQHWGTNAETGVSAKVGLEDKKWGTHIALELKGVAGPLDCRLVAVSTNGARQTVTGWTVPKPGYGVPGSPDPLMVHGGSAIPRAELDRFEVITRNGKQLVSVDV